MSERAKIHLGDIQCECLKRSMDCEKGGVVCDYRPICHAIKNEMPLVWDLRDPPRFNEAQMELLKALWDIGAKIAYRLENTTMFYRKAARDEQVAIIYNRGTDFALQDGETLDLAELFGKDGAEC